MAIDFVLLLHYENHLTSLALVTLLDNQHTNG